jgi:hypothetical protein
VRALLLLLLLAASCTATPIQIPAADGAGPRQPADDLGYSPGKRDAVAGQGPDRATPPPKVACDAGLCLEDCIDAGCSGKREAGAKDAGGDGRAEGGPRETGAGELGAKVEGGASKDALVKPGS